MGDFNGTVEERRGELDGVKRLYALDLRTSDGLLLADNVEVEENKVLHYWLPGGAHGIAHPSEWRRVEEKSTEAVGKMFSERELAPVAQEIYRDLKRDGKVP